MSNIEALLAGLTGYEVVQHPTLPDVVLCRVAGSDAQPLEVAATPLLHDAQFAEGIEFLCKMRHSGIEFAETERFIYRDGHPPTVTDKRYAP